MFSLAQRATNETILINILGLFSLCKCNFKTRMPSLFHHYVKVTYYDVRSENIRLSVHESKYIQTW